jgi:hypothetical protein
LSEEKKRKVVFCTPPLPARSTSTSRRWRRRCRYWSRLGGDEAAVFEVGCPYIIHARARLTRRALDAKRPT